MTAPHELDALQLAILNAIGQCASARFSDIVERVPPVRRAVVVLSLQLVHLVRLGYLVRHEDLPSRYLLTRYGRQALMGHIPRAYGDRA